MSYLDAVGVTLFITKQLNKQHTGTGFFLYDTWYWYTPGIILISEFIIEMRVAPSQKSGLRRARCSSYHTVLLPGASAPATATASPHPHHVGREVGRSLDGGSGDSPFLEVDSGLLSGES
jgi:hypothetical protein